MKLAILVAALAQIVGFVWWSMLPIDHHQCAAYGNFVADNICIPLGGVSMVALVLLGIAQYWEKGKPRGN